ncbi:dTDP-4-dehydrorhamnose reductase [Anditalea andensis]|uniref:dTDP-4-dehydrorhamnose reductase n=1 Tax=Anditalea andensis TaxID=1048983 RepID=A0A074KU76_9BACT|nr:dTDP-4-dehydrorhamnose reductase [Anditalea andensis]KEO71820.1 dTDP-4-dehydrorhamnose reductase [Anditalea andensis]
MIDQNLKILVTGAGGQLGQEIKSLSEVYNRPNWSFADSKALDITDERQVKDYIGAYTPEVIINCAAYTAVDAAESDPNGAFAVNVSGIQNLTAYAGKALIIHISTDFVFDGNSFVAYKETDETHPIGAYGKTKMEGEKLLQHITDNHIIIRTSWLYGSFGKNFMKTMLHLADSRSELSVVADQVGTPTYTGDLALAIIRILEQDQVERGIYHFSNEGVASWYDFAHAIFDMAGKNIKLIPIKSEAYPTPAKRPHFSVLDKTKIKKAIHMEIPHWRDSLEVALKKHLR